MSADSFSSNFASLKGQVDVALHEALKRPDWPEPLLQAVSYSLLAEGKRLRPVLVLMGTHVCGGNQTEALSAACAIEMIHAYSLIHDDLPSMDDDDLRRGRPTSHIVFGEALAILAGDALFTLAFEMIAESSLPAQVKAECVAVLAHAAGGAGMVGGQVLDLQAERGEFPGTAKRSKPILPLGFGQNSGGETDEPAVGVAEFNENAGKATSDSDRTCVEHLIRIHKMKTGALITAALEMGASVASASGEQRRRLRTFGQSVGLAFQIADDLLDVTGSGEKLGKETGRDLQLGKLTYPSLIGVEASRMKAESLVDEACGALDVFDDRADFLRKLARFIVERDH
ncbi:MAG: polyprenyl synthetase family protein [Planctomycetaceae bacterium]